jgi:hypothetical protein
MTPLADSASGLLRDSLREYWRHDMGVHSRTNDEVVLPDGFWGHREGIYGLQFTGLSHGWKIRVSFDSADFPELEAVLEEAQRLKQDFATDINQLAAQ